MDFEQFFKKLHNNLKNIDIEIDIYDAELFWKYTNLLLEWNDKINLTAITDINEIIVKHFTDSLTICNLIEKDSNIIDVGTGAGFPGVPIAIIRKDINVTLVDSLNKRINFLNDLQQKLNLKNVEIIHSRAEELGKKVEYREKYDVAVSRAVAPLNILLEYLVPFTKVHGKILCMKGPNVSEEIKLIDNALNELKSNVKSIDKIQLNDMERNILIIEKDKETDAKYPRNPGIPSKKPL